MLTPEIERTFEEMENHELWTPELQTDSWQKVLKTVNIPPNKPVHRVHFLRTAWFKYAAAVIILFGAGIYFYTRDAGQKKKTVISNIKPINDIGPGGDKSDAYSC